MAFIVPQHPVSGRLTRVSLSGTADRQQKPVSFSLSRLAGFVLPLCVLSAPAAAVTLPSAGSLGNQLRQETETVPAAAVMPVPVFPQTPQTGRAAPGGATVQISRVVVRGLEGTGVTPAEAAAAVADRLSQPQDFAGLQQMAAQITALLQQRGNLLAQAILPAQTLSSGTLIIQVIPGRYDTAAVNNTAGIRPAVVLRMVEAATPPGEVVRKDRLERLALLLAELPGARTELSLRTGGSEGTVQPVVDLQPGKRVGGYLGADNQGDAVTGRQRVMGGVYVNELFGTGDQLRVDLLDAYQRSALFNGALDYSTQINGYGTRAGVNYSHLNYRYHLQGLGFSGRSDNWGVYLSHPWFRNARARVDVRAEAGQQQLTDRYPAVFASLSGEGREGRKQVSSGSVSVRGSLATSPGGLTGFSLQGTVGNVEYRSSLSRFLSRADTAGQFARFNYQLSHEQSTGGQFSVYGALNGQIANRDLDPSQKLILGGPFAVRAYDTGTGAADQGNVLTGEVRRRWPVQTAYLGRDPALVVAGFYDQAWGQQYRTNSDPKTGGALTNDNNRFSLAGAGLYASLTDAGNYALTLTWAHRTGMADPVSGNTARDQFWFTGVKTF